MTAVTFPTNPSNGDTYLVNGRTYVYTSTTNTWSVPSTYSGIFNPIDSKSYVATSGQSTFSVTYTNGLVEAYVNGIKIDPVGYSATNGTSITFNTGLTAGDVVNLVGYSGSVGVTATTLSELSDVSTTAPTDRQVLAWNNSSSVWAPANTGIAIYATVNDLPLSGNNTGDQAFVSATNRLYLWNGTGWYNIALINTNPSISSGYSSSYSFATDGTPIEITLVGSDPEGIPLTWSYEVTTGSLTNGGGTTATVSQSNNVFTLTPTTTTDYAGSFSITWKASDGVNLGTAVSSFTLQFIIANSKYTSLLVKAESTGNNATFVDSGDNTLTITKNGDVTQGTFSPYIREEGYWSNYFDGDGDYFRTSSIAIGTSDFTIECWFYAERTQTYQGIFDGRPNSTNGAYPLLMINNSSVVWYVGGASRISSSAITLNKWYHVAVSRTGGTTTLYINGASAGTYSDSNNYLCRTDPPIGALDTGGNTLKGYISNLRILVGSGAAIDYSSTPVPTDPLTAVTNTVLLTCQSNIFKDNSTNAFALTPAGNVSVSAFGPFDRGQYNPAVNGGSAYFDGDGDYLTLPADSAFSPGTGEFTIDFWYYPLVALANAAIFDTRTSSTSTNGILIAQGAASGNSLAIVFYMYNGTRIYGPDLVLNTWNHIAVVRNSSNAITVYTNGVGGTPTTISNDLTNGTSNTPYIGRFVDNSASPYCPNGYISDFRMVNGDAIYTSDFTPPTSPTSGTGAALKLNCANADILDYSGNSNLQLVGNTSVNTTTKKWPAATGSVYFDGSGDYLLTSASTDYDFGYGDWTIEAWVYFATVANAPHIIQIGTASNARITLWAYQQVVRVYSNSGSGTDVIIGTTTISADQWYHLAVSFDASTTTTRLYINGQIEGSNTSYNSYIKGAPRQLVSGYQPWGGNSNDYLNGYVEDLRVTKGLARYTANFTPPTSELLG